MSGQAEVIGSEVSKGNSSPPHTVSTYIYSLQNLQQTENHFSISQHTLHDNAIDSCVDIVSFANGAVGEASEDGGGTSEGACGEGDPNTEPLSPISQNASYDRLNPYANPGELEPVNIVSFAYQIASGMVRLILSLKPHPLHCHIMVSLCTSHPSTYSLSVTLSNTFSMVLSHCRSTCPVWGSSTETWPAGTSSSEKENSSRSPTLAWLVQQWMRYIYIQKVTFLKYENFFQKNEV